mgnify:CR=1 FL=1
METKSKKNKPNNVLVKKTKQQIKNKLTKESMSDPIVKITIEVSKSGYSRIVEYKDRVYRENFEKTEYGATSKSSFDNQKSLPRFIKNNLDDSYDLMIAMSKVK